MCVETIESTLVGAEVSRVGSKRSRNSRVWAFAHSRYSPTLAVMQEGISEPRNSKCRTRVLNDATCDIQSPVGRGNLSFSTLNLPMIAAKYKYELHGNDFEEFLMLLDDYIDLGIKQLKQRFEFQKTAKAGNFQFLYENGTWKDGDKLKPHEEVGDLLKTGTLALGFIGLAETLTLLFGTHHGENKESLEKGLELIGHMHKRMKEQSALDSLNWSVIATPAESYCGKALRKFKDKYGVIEGVSDKEYFTNSNHVPVGYDISAIDKIKIESKFHPVTLGGHILYIELDGDATKNIKAMDKIVQAMIQEGAGYFAINIPNDRCLDCSYDGMINTDTCPVCGSESISRIRRITGYLTGSLDRWNSAKQAEHNDRIKHSIRD